MTVASAPTSVSPAEPQVLITREFDAARSLVFRAWTNPEHLKRWFAPRGCETTFRSLDFRAGGAFHSCVRTPDRQECWCKGIYLEIAEPERIVFTMLVSNEQGDSVEPTEAGMDPDWPRETTVTVTFAERDGRTILTLHQTVSETVAKRTGAHPSWLQMLDRLEESLANR